MNSSESIAERIRLQIKSLANELQGQPQKVESIVATFSKQTPAMLEEFTEMILKEKWTDAASRLHKLKAGFGYLGLQDVQDACTAFELVLRSGKIEDPQQFVTHLRNATSQAVAAINNIDLQDMRLQTASDHQPLNGRKILIAEDDEINAMVFELLVQETGATTLLATDGRRVLELAREQAPDMIFMDVHMPFVSGLDAIRALRKDGFTLPIVSLSASTRLNEKQNSLDAGANDFLVKPANRESIHQILLKYLLN